MNDIATPSVPVSTAARRPAPGGHTLRQLGSVVRLELRKSFAGRRGLGTVALAVSPVLIPLLRFLDIEHGEHPVTDATQFFSYLYQIFSLRVALFLACVAVFGNMIRREILDRTLHYYFLTPMRREVLVAAKYLAGLAITLPLFLASTLVAFVLSYLPHDGVQEYLFRGPGLSHLGSYLLVTVLACIGYGGVFLLLGALFKSPAIPALAVMGWEAIHFLLPPLLKKISVIHYLQSLCPVPMDEGPFAILADAPSPWISIPGLLILSALMVGIAAWKIRGMEVMYEEE